MGNEKKSNIYDAVFRISQGNFDLFDQMSKDFAETVKKAADKLPPAVNTPGGIGAKDAVVKVVKRKSAGA